MLKKLKPGLVLQPDTYRGMYDGFSQLVNAIRPTLGPYPRWVVNEPTIRNKKPEFFDDGGIVARRIIQLRDRNADVGAMFLRHVLWEVREKVGDGTATTAVLFFSIFEQGMRYITAGGNSMRLHFYLDQGLKVILDELEGMTRSCHGRQNLARVAKTVCFDAELANVMGELVDILGEFGELNITEDYGRGVRREYVEGAFWPSMIVGSDYFTGSNSVKKVIDEPAILITNLDVEEPQILLPIVEKCVRAGKRKLVLIANNYSDNSLHIIPITNQDPAKFQLLAVKTPGVSPDDQANNMEDMAFLTGGKPRIKAAGDALEYFKPDQLGYARQVWATKDYLGIIHGKGDPMNQRAHMIRLKKAHMVSNNKEERRQFQTRLSKFWNGSANLFVGGVNKNEVEERKGQAERTLDLLRGALRDGVLPGGGVALMACKPALQARLSGDYEPEKMAAFRILLHALEAPMRTILTNAGYDASEIMADVKKASPGVGFDVVSGKIVDVVETGIQDVASVIMEAVHAAVSSAGLALTTDIIVHRKNPEESTKP